MCDSGVPQLLVEVVASAAIAAALGRATKR